MRHGLAWWDIPFFITLLTISILGLRAKEAPWLIAVPIAIVAALVRWWRFG